MSEQTKIQWTDCTWNPVRGCSRVSAGCEHCYAERQAARFSGPGQYAHGFVERTARGPRWTRRVEIVPEKLREPLSWSRPRRIFVNSMSDLFHESLPDEAIDRVFAVMALAPQHTFQVLTKRPERMHAYLTADGVQKRIAMAAADLPKARVKTDAPATLVRWFADGGAELVPWPLPNVWIGISAEGQPSLDARGQFLLQCPAAVRFVSAEPLLEPLDFRAVHYQDGDALFVGPMGGSEWSGAPRQLLDWVIVGGESGPGARPCDVAWVRSIVEQCRAARVACFVKQLGAWARLERVEFDPPKKVPRVGRRRGHEVTAEEVCLKLRDPKGGDPAEWPEDLRVREFPSQSSKPGHRT